MFFGDVFRSAPFDTASTHPRRDRQPRRSSAGWARRARRGASKSAARRGAGAAAPELALDPASCRVCATCAGATKPCRSCKNTLTRTEQQIGSNEWAVAGWRTKDGRPLVANDPHLSLDLPPNFYQMHLSAQKDGLDAIGSSVAGTPWVVLGQNQYVTWGETTTGFDVTDTYLEQLVPDATLAERPLRRSTWARSST